MSEFKIINQYIKQVETDDSVILGIGDDAAVMQVPEGSQIVQTMDTMVLDIHFDNSFSADALAHKLLHVNLSDIAAMGARPKWATVALTMPELQEPWIADFSAGLQSRCALFGINLIGGDTTSGPLSVTMNLTGLVKTGCFLTRSGAQKDDDIYVSGFLGDAALALSETGCDHEALASRLHYPQARLELGVLLHESASACLDISDGLLADLQHICVASQVNAEIEVGKLPISNEYKNYFETQNRPINPDFALNGGDDYELCFTVPNDKREKIEALNSQLDHSITRIGRITQANEAYSVKCILNGNDYQCGRAGWEHFARKK